jgi:hypothetical protein
MLRGAGDITRAQAAALLHPGNPPAGFQWCLRGTLSSGTAIPAADSLRLTPVFDIVRAIQLISLSIQVQVGGAGSSAKIALWRNDPLTARPVGTPVFGSNTPLDTTVTALRTVAGSVAAEPGVYWFGSVYTGTMPAVWADNGNTTFRGIIHLGGPVSSNAGGFAVAQTFTDDIMARNLTGVSLTAVATVSPICGIGWA